MESWLLYGLLAAVFYGTSTIAFKVATSEQHLAGKAGHVLIFVLVGIAIVVLAYAFLVEKNLQIAESSKALGVGMLAGILWALGTAVVFIALKSGADVARIVPIFNTNTLIAVVLGIVLLKELPAAADQMKVIAGAVLIVIGSFLVSG